MNPSAARKAPRAKKRRVIPPSWSSTLWHTRIRRVSGARVARSRITARYGSPQKAVHHGISTASGFPDAIASAVLLQEPGER